ncbi:hypothetical protein EJ03DRAFT_254888, partial [Teratosphaeria nubilosa]
ESMLQYIKDNPGDTASYVVQGIVFINPCLVSGPALRLLGFGFRGPTAETIATVLHSRLGAVPAGSWFAIADSAAMGGQGKMAVNGLVRVGTAAVGLAKWAIGR